MSRHPEGCESGRIGTIGNRVSFTGPWVQIPPSPRNGLVAGRLPPNRRAPCRRRDAHGPIVSRRRSIICACNETPES